MYDYILRKGVVPPGVSCYMILLFQSVKAIKTVFYNFLHNMKVLYLFRLNTTNTYTANIVESLDRGVKSCYQNKNKCWQSGRASNNFST